MLAGEDFFSELQKTFNFKSLLVRRIWMSTSDSFIIWYYSVGKIITNELVSAQTFISNEIRVPGEY